MTPLSNRASADSLISTRRDFLRAGTLALGGLTLGDLFRLRAQSQAKAATEPAKTNDLDTSVIFVWLPGGPPHMETFDLKPDAPTEYRGEFRPIPTKVPGTWISEHLPKLASIADQYNIIRSVAHEFADHGGGHKRFMTGRHPATPVGFVNDAPAVGSIVAKMVENRDRGMPNYVLGADGGREGVDVFSLGAAYLGPSYVPFGFGGDPSDPKFQIRNLDLPTELSDPARWQDRARLLKTVDQLQRSIDQSGMINAMDQFDRTALKILLGDKARKAFDLNLEPRHVRERYGMHAWGQRALMARRLVEAGCTFVTMVMENPTPNKPLPKDVTYNWDSHAVNCHMFMDTKFRSPFLDQAISTLIEDVHQRGLDKKVLVIITGEFGRTPMITYSNGRPGRDHWPNAMSMLVTGGGMANGQVIGSTTAKGEEPKDRRLTPNDLWATVYKHLGIDYHHSFLDRNGRPLAILPYGEPITELLPV